jgi:predicted nucleic acid-binding protein
MTGTLPIYCWDSSVCVEWCSESSDYANDIELVVNEIESGKAGLILPVSVIGEVLDWNDSGANFQRFEDLQKHPHVDIVNIDVRIAKKAATLRTALKKAGKSSPKIGDAMVIATAIVYRVDVLHTKDSQNSFMGLSETEFVSGLRITAPRPLSGQKALAPIPNRTPTTPRDGNKAARHLSQHMRSMMSRSIEDHRLAFRQSPFVPGDWPNV